MRESNLFLTGLVICFLLMMAFTDINLEREFRKIDLSDEFKNYTSLDSVAYTVLHISGSNGYPMRIIHSDENRLKALRSRVEHIKYNTRADTLFLEYTGTNISYQQARFTQTPPALILEVSALKEVVAENVHVQIVDFASDEIRVVNSEATFMEIINCCFGNMHVESSDNTHLEFLNQNYVDTLELTMSGAATAFMKNVDLQCVQHDLGDSVSIVLSSPVFGRLIQ